MTSLILITNDRLMKNLLLFCFSLVLCNALHAQPSDAYLTARLNAGKMPGASIVIIKEGHWVYNKSLGKADIAGNKDVTRHTIFMLASISKTIVATAVMQQWQKGALMLDIDVNNYLPFQLHHPTHPNDSITLRMLLTHTSSIKDNWNVMGSLYVYGDSPMSLDTFMKHYYIPGGNYYNATNNFYTYQPGLQWNYSNMAITLAAYIVERVTGDQFSHYCDTAIFNKICMKNTSWLLSGLQDTTLIARPYSWISGAYEDNGLYGYPDYPDGQLRTNVTALARFMTMYMQYGIYNGVRLLDSSTVAYMLQSQTPIDPGQGIVFYSASSSNGDLLWGHNGGDAGVNTAMYFSMVKKTGAIVLTNGEGTSGSNADLLVDTLYKYGLTIAPGATDTFPDCNEIITAVASVEQSAEDFTISPNPTSGRLNVKVGNSATMMLIDLQGKIQAEYRLKEGTTGISLAESLPAGIYFARIYSKDGRLIGIRKIILMQ
jgi:CubicO group peptidase (beta-lactamase class C family)